MAGNYDAVKKWRKSNKAKLVEAFGGACLTCGLVDDGVVFDFHHLDPEKKDFRISAQIKSWEKVIAEVSKCVMLCSNCHRKVHAGLIVVPHGNLNLPDFKSRRPTEPCPVCSKPKPVAQVTCSLACGGKRLSKVDWDAIDLEKLVEVHSSANAIGKQLGVSHGAVLKQLKKRGLKFNKE